MLLRTVCVLPASRPIGMHPLINPRRLRSAGTAPIHFTFRPIAFTLDSSETPERHAPETMAGGVAVFDYDNDGYLDIFFTNGADISTLQKSSPKYWNRLFHNNGDGTFTDVTEKAGVEGTGFDTGVAIGDFDNDGYQDMFVGGVHHNALYHNNGNGTFTDITEKAGLAHPDKEYGPLWSVGGAWVDVNNDGLLDLFVVNYLSWDGTKEPDCKVFGKPDYCHPKFYKPTPNQLFLNKGDGTFVDISAESGIRAHPGKGMGVGVADYDNDGLPDLFVTNDKLPNFLFHNLGNGHFQEVAFQAGVALPDNGNDISAMGLDFQDLNNDGFPDISVVALQDETFPLYRNDKKGFFTDITVESGNGRTERPDGWIQSEHRGLRQRRLERYFRLSRWCAVIGYRAIASSSQRAAQHGIPQPPRRKVDGPYRGSGICSTAAQPSSRIGIRRFQSRRETRSGSDCPSCARRTLDQQQPRREPLVRTSHSKARKAIAMELERESQ